MTDFLALAKKTNAYKIMKGDKASNRLSHAYLLLTADGANLIEFVKVFAKLIMCEGEEPCNACRACTLIDKQNFSDVLFYPKNGTSITADDVTDIIEESYLRPIESDKKLFVLLNGEAMNLTAQNKLLKTLEEPPKNVHILIGATTEYPLLFTLKSRVKKLEIPPFNDQTLFQALKNDCVDAERLTQAIACGDGTVGRAVALYGDQNFNKVVDFVNDVLVNMKSSKDVLEYSVKMTNQKIDFVQFLGVLELALKDLLSGANGKVELVKNKKLYESTKSANGYCVGAIVYILEKVNEAFRRKKANANAQMLTEWLLFQILEGKFKWQKL